MVDSPNATMYAALQKMASNVNSLWSFHIFFFFKPRTYRPTKTYTHTHTCSTHARTDTHRHTQTHTHTHTQTPYTNQMHLTPHRLIIQIINTTHHIHTQRQT